MSRGGDYYSVLGVSKTASNDDIKRAYRKAALQWHPDKNPGNMEFAEAVFKDVAEAYEVLSDPNRRALYDAGGEGALGSNGGGDRGGGFQGGGMGMNGAFNIFEQFFGGHDPFARMDATFAEMNGHWQRQHVGRSPFGMGSAFNDPFFDASFSSHTGSGCGGSRSFSSNSFGGNSFSSFSSSSGGGRSTMTSTSTTTKIVNGRRVTVTEKTVRKPDGTVETTRSESEGGGASGGDTTQSQFFSGGPGGGDFGGGWFGGSWQGNGGSGF